MWFDFFSQQILIINFLLTKKNWNTNFSSLPPFSFYTLITLGIIVVWQSTLPQMTILQWQKLVDYSSISITTHPRKLCYPIIDNVVITYEAWILQSFVVFSVWHASVSESDTDTTSVLYSIFWTLQVSRCPCPYRYRCFIGDNNIVN